jgi:hypothetical protein
MAGSMAGFEVRAATERDGPRMAEIDRLAFGTAGMGHYGESHFRCWREVNPEGLLVASQGGAAIACCYSQYVDFSPEDVSLGMPRPLVLNPPLLPTHAVSETHAPPGPVVVRSVPPTAVTNGSSAG